MLRLLLTIAAVIVACAVSWFIVLAVWALAWNLLN